MQAVLLSSLLKSVMAFAQEPAPTPPDSAATAAEPTQLPGVNVEAKRRNPFEESDRRLRELINTSTPCLGCDAKKPVVPPSLLDQVLDGALDLVTPQASQPRNHDGDTQGEVDRADYERRHPANSSP